MKVARVTTRQGVIQFDQRRWLTVSLAAFLCLTFNLSPAHADQTTDVQNKLKTQNGQISDLQSQIDSADEHAATLQGQLAIMQSDAAKIQAEIDATGRDMAVVQGHLAQLDAEMATKQDLLRQQLRQQYYLANTSTLELLATSDSLGEFVDRREYLASASNRITDLLNDVMVVKKTVVAEQDRLAVLTDQQTAKKNDLVQQQALTAKLLADTQGQEANYKTLLKQAEVARNDLAEQLLKLSGSDLKSQGYVTQGQVIGHEGSTGFSTGAHTHFGVYVNRVAVNGLPYVQSGQLHWPLDDFSITQGFGPANWSNSLYTFHDGIDISGPYGEAVHAAASGNVIVNDFQANGFGHYIIIDHGNGLWTLYGHMQ